MKELKIEAQTPVYAMPPNMLKRKEVRVLDKCRHFLGKNLEGEIYIYCGRCKCFVLVRKQ